MWPQVCPGNWIFHKLAIRDTAMTHYAGGVRFSIHVHTGDVYYAMSRWERPPGFATCNANEATLEGSKEAHVDLCDLYARFTDVNATGAVAASDGDTDGIDSGLADGAAAADAAHATGNHTHRRQLLLDDTSEVLSDQVVYGYLGLFGGLACAHYTVETHYLPYNATCSTATVSSCNRDV